ncbi:MAG TPA: HWE histidine kinase domain-containing protein [Pseudolabrys sp.]|nr:HWE histidine kinase domain-containing protein [Pseudolabrys sp.]
MNDARDSAERLRRQQSALADFGLYALRAKELDPLLQRATELVSEALQIRLVKVLQLCKAEHAMLVRAGVNWKPGVVGHAKLGADHESPSGYALQTHEPVVSADLARETRFTVPQLLIDHGVKSTVNVIIEGDGEPFGVLEVDSTERRPFDGDAVAFLRNYANLLAAAITRFRSHEELTETMGQLELLSRELQHRVKNTLAIVQSLANQTATQGQSAAEFRSAFLARLHALNRAQNFTLVSVEGRADMRELLTSVLEPYRKGPGERVSVDGEPVEVNARQAMMLGLAAHELSTNASKYGALSNDKGSVRVTWDTTSGPERTVTLHWREQDGPPVKPPASTGFGSRMIERICAGELGGRAEIRYPRHGLECDISFDR